MKLKEPYGDNFIEVDELKPCPFCGSTEHLNITDKRSFSELCCEFGFATVVINCRQCDLKLYERSYSSPLYDERVRLLLEKWNCRAKEETE